MSVILSFYIIDRTIKFQESKKEIGMIDRILKIMKENNGIITPAQLEKKNTDIKVQIKLLMKQKK